MLSAKDSQQQDQHAALITGIPVGLLDRSGTAVKVYLALRSHERTVGKGAFPSVAKVARMIGVSERMVWRAVSELCEAGAVTKQSRGRAKSNRYCFPANLIDTTHTDKNDRASVTLAAHEVTTPKERQALSTYLEDTKPSELTGRTFGTNTAAGGGLGVIDESVVEPVGQRSNAGNPGGAFRPRLGRSIFGEPPVDYKKPLVERDLERSANEILDLLDRLRVEKMRARPITEGSRPGQLTSARYLVAFDRRPAKQILDVIRWTFNGSSANAVWAGRITKVFELRRQYPALLDAYRKAEQVDVAEHIEPRIPGCGPSVLLPLSNERFDQMCREMQARLAAARR